MMLRWQLPNSIYKFSAISKKKSIISWSLTTHSKIYDRAMGQDNYKDQCGETWPLRCECLL